MDSSTPPKISVIIPVYNCENTVGKCLESLLQQVETDFEIIMVDDGSTDRTVEICRAFQGVVVLSQKQGGPSRARNVGIRTARGEYAAFTDGDCVVDPHWLVELQKGFSAPEIAGVGGDQASPDDETATGALIQDFLKTIGFAGEYIQSGTALKETNHNPTCNAIYRKKALEEVGGFDESLWPGEDVDLDFRIRNAGWRLVYNPNALVRHYRPKTHKAYARMMMRYGASQRRLVKKHGYFRKIHYEPFALCFCALCFAALFVLKPVTWPLLIVCPAAAPLGFFFKKTGSVNKSFAYFRLLAITLVYWNWGFATGGRRNSPSTAG